MATLFQGKGIQNVGYSDTGWKVVEEQDIEIVAPLLNISRKVMLPSVNQVFFEI